MLTIFVVYVFLNSLAFDIDYGFEFADFRYRRFHRRLVMWLHIELHGHCSACPNNWGLDR